jgi:DNA-binding NtrC family response regulator
VKKEFAILIADRNPRVRSFLKREMAAEGYKVRLAENGREVLKWVYNTEPLDLVILDPDLPDTEEAVLLKKLQDRIPPVPLILHTFTSEYAALSAGLRVGTFVEKKGSSVERLKTVIADILRSSPIGR